MNAGNLHEQTLRRVVDAGWTREQLREAAALERAIAADADLARAVTELDALRETLSPSGEACSATVEPSRDDDALRDRLRAAVGAGGGRHNNGRSPWVRRAFPGMVGGVLAAAAMWLLMIAVPARLSAPRATPAPSDQAHAPRPQLMPELPQQQRQMLDQLASFYEGKAGWVATTAQHVHFGLNDAPVAWAEPVVMRLTLSGPSRRTVQTDIAMLPGQVIDVDAATPDGQAIRYRVRVSADQGPRGRAGDSIAITALVDGSDSITTRVPLDGTPVRSVARLLTRSGEYEVLLGVAQ